MAQSLRYFTLQNIVNLPLAIFIVRIYCPFVILSLLLSNVYYAYGPSPVKYAIATYSHYRLQNIWNNYKTEIWLINMYSQIL